MSPEAMRPVSLLARVSIEVSLFVVAAIALWLADARGAALELASLGIATSILNAATEREGLPR